MRLPRLLCDLFRLEVPDTDFTTIRMQKFASAANFGGAHRTLPVNLHTPYFPDEDGSSSPEPMECDSGGVPAFALCLTEGCKGGHGELLENSEVRRWHSFVNPHVGPSASQWMQFPMDTWLRWYWPTKGDYYVITTTCEPPEFLRGLHARQHRQMLKVGFRLPEPWNHVPQEESHEDDAKDEGKGREGRQRSPRRMSSARVLAAKRLLGLSKVVLLTIQEIEDAFATAQRQASVDVFPRNSSEGSAGRIGWDLAQLSWARRVLSEAHQAAQEAAVDGVLPQWMQEEHVGGDPIPISSAGPVGALPLPAP